MSFTDLPLANQYHNAIDAQEASDGILLSLANAKELLADATLLLENKRYARALALTILAVEEAGKVEPIKNLLLDKQRVKSLWRDVRSHKAKNFHWIFPLLKEEGVTDNDFVRQLANTHSNSAKYLDQLKQLSLYVEAVTEEGKCTWLEPSKFITAELAIFQLVEAYKVVHDDRIKWTPEALEVFVKHATIENGEVKYDNLLTYYRDLYDGEHITEERFRKIYFNICQTEYDD